MTTPRYKRLEIEWKHFAVGDATCERCGKTGDALRGVIGELRNEFAPSGVKINLTETLLDKTRIAESNEILMNGVQVEDLLAADIVSTECPSCGTLAGESTCCRAIEIGNDRYEEIPAELIKKAAYRAPWSKRMKIGIVSDGKFGDRAYEIIRERFPTEWIMAPFPQGIMVDDIELTLPECDLYISYVRHPDVALAIIENQKPVILGVSFGPGFLLQAKGINENIVAPPTMCSLEDNTWVPAINEFAKFFGRPIFDVKVQDNGTIDSVRVIRGSPCGSTVAASAELPGTKLSPEQLRHYGLRICHFCRAPRLGKTCDKEVAGLLHIRDLVRSINSVFPAAGERVKSFTDEMEKIIDQKLTRG